MKVNEVLAAYVFGFLTPDSLPALGVQFLESGYDSYSMRRLAAASPSDSDIRELFLMGMKELGIVLPSEKEAGRIIALEIARRVIEGSIDPYEGAKRIWDRVYTRLPCLEELRPFVGLASEYEDDIGHRIEYERDIFEACRKLDASSHRAEPKTSGFDS